MTGDSTAPPRDLGSISRVLADAGCVAANEEAAELLAAFTAGASVDGPALDAALGRRCRGEPLAWITGVILFCGIELAIDTGIYVPRWQSEPLAKRAADVLPTMGTAVDLCTGTGAIARVMADAKPQARVVGTELDPRATACARRNGVVTFEGDLDRPLPLDLTSRVDVITGVLPYVPHGSLELLPRDVLGFEPVLALDGGADGLEHVAHAVARSSRWLVPGGVLLLEVGTDQVAPVTDLFARAGFGEIRIVEDGDCDPRGVEGRISSD